MGQIPYSMIGHKCYYKERDITDLLNAKISVLPEINASQNEENSDNLKEIIEVNYRKIKQ